MVDYYAALCALVRKEPSPHKGEVWLTCPECGKGNKHFSISPRGVKCFHCGYKPSLRKLYERFAGDGCPEEVERPEVKIRIRPWQTRADVLAESFHKSPRLIEKWQAYKPVPEYLIERNKLGYGAFPGGLWYPGGVCNHPRLIVPLYDEGKVVGFRCRAVECGCKKWLSPTGTVLTLYNSQYLTTGKPVMIVENPADALLIESRGMSSVATLGVTVWKDSYYDKVRGASFRWVAFDNDEPGREAAYKLVRKLNQRHLPARSYSWRKYPRAEDIGQVITMQMQHA